MPRGSNVCDNLARPRLNACMRCRPPLAGHQSTRKVGRAGGQGGGAISGVVSNRCAARHWRGRARSGGSSGEHAMKIIERDVAGASSGEAYQARHGAAAALSCRRGARKCILSRIGSRARAHHGKRRGQIHFGVAEMRRPLLVRRIPAVRAVCPPPVGGGERREGGPGPRRARFRRRLCFCANFFCCGGCIGSSAFVSCCWRGLGVRAAASPRDEAVPPREKCKGEQTHVRRPPPPAGLQKGALAWAHYVKTAFLHSLRILTGSFGGPERWMDAKGLLGRLRWRLRRRPWRG